MSLFKFFFKILLGPKFHIEPATAIALGTAGGGLLGGLAQANAAEQAARINAAAQREALLRKIQADELAQARASVENTLARQAQAFQQAGNPQSVQQLAAILRGSFL